MILIAAVLVGMIPIIPAVIYFFLERKSMPSRAARSLVLGLNGFNGILLLMAAGFGIVWLASPSTAMAAGAAAAAGGDAYQTLAAALSTGLACIGGGIGVASSGAAAIGAIAEKPEAFGRALIFVGLAEGIAIYGLIISFLILQRP
ncbi:MAG TPA: ATP synthase subunit C [Anaerolineaceae bacterium]|jgi:V/A-type H+-transporting ATPase subunit K